MKAMVFILSLLLFSGLAYAQGAYSYTTNVSVFSYWLPIVIIAVFIGVAISLGYYMVATLLNNSRLKQNALAEFYQVLGTVGVLVIIIMILNAYGTGIYQGDATLSAAATAICTTSQLGSSPLLLTNSGVAGPTENICSQIIDVQSTGSSDITTNIDYGLAATYVLMANVTSQAAVNLNALNVLENYYSTLATVNPTESVCWPESCIASPAGQAFSATYSYLPFWFYGKIRGGTLYIGTEAQIAFYMGVLQMVIIIIMLFGWPYLLAAGLVLRASFFTRKAGGLMLAIVLVGMVLYPMLNAFEYSAMANANSPLVPIGANTVTSTTYNAMTLVGTPTTTTGTAAANTITYGVSNFNFYVYPRLDYILNYDGCWPPGGSVLLGETQVAGGYVIPGIGLYLALKDFIGSFVNAVIEPSSPTYGFNCTPANLFEAIVNIADLYGMVFTSSVLVYILNILMLLSAIKGISSMLGGDTSLLGIGRLL